MHRRTWDVDIAPQFYLCLMLILRLRSVGAPLVVCCSHAALAMRLLLLVGIQWNGGGSSSYCELHIDDCRVLQHVARGMVLHVVGASA